jgi:uncharacterized protein
MKPIVTAGMAGPRRGALRFALWASTVLLVHALAACAWLDEQQRMLALRPTAGQPSQFAGLRPGDQRSAVSVATDNGSAEQVSMWWLPHPDPGAPTMLYLHGTFRNLYQNLPKIEAWREAGFAIVAVDYRGWGDSTIIVPSEATISADAWSAWAELVRRQPDAGKRIVFGHSMGSAVAVILASQLTHPSDYRALVLEAAFTRMPEVAAAAGFWGRIGAAVTTQQFDAIDRIARVDAPIWMLHGSADQTVPVGLGQRLRDAAKPGVHWIEVPGGSHSRLHSEAPELYPRVAREIMN